MLHFAYGSNMDWGQMRERCPSARFVGIAQLRDHRLAFTRKSTRRGCGVADALRDPAGKVWGVVYEISDLDVARLDSREGYQPGRDKNSYWRRECMVFLGGADDGPLKVWAYFAEPQPSPPLPNEAYKNLILTGARHWRLPEEYIQELELIEVGP